MSDRSASESTATSNESLGEAAASRANDTQPGQVQRAQSPRSHASTINTVLLCAVVAMASSALTAVLPHLLAFTAAPQCNDGAISAFQLHLSPSLSLIRQLPKANATVDACLSRFSAWSICILTVAATALAMRPTVHAAHLLHLQCSQARRRARAQCKASSNYFNWQLTHSYSLLAASYTDVYSISASCMLLMTLNALHVALLALVLCPLSRAAALHDLPNQLARQSYDHFGTPHAPPKLSLIHI